MSKEAKPFNYFDTPDGEDVVKKLMIVAKPAAITALAIGTCDVMLYSKPKGYMGTLGRYIYVSIPIIGMSAVFVIASNMAGSIRKKDDIWNWAAGGAAAGGVLGAWRHSPQVGNISAAVLAFSCGVKKYAVQNGIIINPSLSGPKMHGGVKAVRHDFSLLEDKTGEWRKKYQ